MANFALLSLERMASGCPLGKGCCCAQENKIRGYSSTTIVTCLLLTYRLSPIDCPLKQVSLLALALSGTNLAASFFYKPKCRSRRGSGRSRPAQEWVGTQYLQSFAEWKV